MRWIERAFARAVWLAVWLGSALGVTALAQAPPAPAQRFQVALNAAHGGDDAGAKLAGSNGDIILEKDYDLALSVRLRSLLEARGMSVVTTRESDITLDAGQRAEIANQARAQACLSLHAAMSGSGVHLFLSSLAPAPRITFLPWKTAQAAWLSRSAALAGALKAALVQAGIKVTIGYAALPALDSMACPAAAVEVAPQRPDGKFESMDGGAYQAQIAQALAAGLLEWRAEGENP